MTESTLPFPFEDDLTLEGVQFQFAIDTRSDDTNLHYRFGVPTGWSQDETPAKQVERSTDFVQLSRFSSPEDDQFVALSLNRLPREVGGSAWLHLAMQEEERAVLDRRDVYSLSGNMPDVLSRRWTKYGPRIERTVAYKLGDCLFRIEYSSPEDLYQNHSDLAYVVTHSFEPFLNGASNYAEDVNTFPLGESHAIALPGSWDAVECRFGSLDQTLTALGGSLCEWESRVDDQWSGTIFAGKSAHVDGDFETLRLAFIGDLSARSIPLSRVELREVEVEGTQFESGVWIEPRLGTTEFECFYSGMLLLATSNQTLVLGQLGPALETDPQWTAINQRAFEIARDSLTLN